MCLDHLKKLQMQINFQRDLLETEMDVAALHTNLKKKITVRLATINSLGYSCPPANSIKPVVPYASILVLNLILSSRSMTSQLHNYIKSFMSHEY